MLIKRHAFIAVLSLYVMSKWNKQLNMSLNNIKMEFPEQGQNWLPSLSLEDDRAQTWNGHHRHEWRKQILTSLFAENIDPLIRQLEKSTGITRVILWENIAVYLFWLYETELKDHKDATVNGDFTYLLFGAEGSIFGTYSLNPLQRYFGDPANMINYNNEVRMRSTCCFSYQLKARNRCKTCPCTQKTQNGRCQDGKGIYCSVRSITRKIQ
ncbi:siderophore-iron reductase FhuF [Neobacillus cucumis]|uniref:siderophore-iron reductase FhuF n=1 Tax=Neobacillus cucumis TaxID=1740721 RepID=UPI002E248D93|nr:siderophore-iron reductase FhuF [Neobacillus cucumis]MED4225369.1 siderophore-iron reductase FhuF [Neobacillus cucumis]